MSLLLLLCSVASVVHASSLSNGLLALYTFDADSLEDSSVNMYNGNAVGSIAYTYGQAGFGRALDLTNEASGDNSNYVEVSNGADNLSGVQSGDVTGPAPGTAQDGALTVSLWFRAGTMNKNFQTLIATGENGLWRMSRTGTTDFVQTRVGGGDLTNSVAVLNDGQWHHVVATAESTSVGPTGRRSFIDGVQVASNTGASFNSLNGPLFIGNNPQSLMRAWNGALDDVAIWNRVLTADELDQIFFASLSSIIDPQAE